MRNVFVAAALILTLIAPARASAWSFDAHTYIMRAIEMRPSKLNPFYNRYRDEIVVRVIDPDLWRRVGWDEEPNTSSISARRSTSSIRF